MKNLFKIAFTLVLGFMLFNCTNKEQQPEKIDLIDNSANVNKLINAFDLLVDKSLANSNLSDDELGKLFMDEAKKSGLNIVKVEQKNPIRVKSNDSSQKFSNEYLKFSDEIQNAPSYPKKEEFKNSLTKLNADVLNSTISIKEKQILVDNIRFMVAFVDWMEKLEQSKNVATKGKKSWWKRWGKCVAGTLGGAITTGLEGCGIGAGVGGAIGTAAAGVGVVPGVVGGCVAGGVVGIVGGGLKGASESC